MLPHLHDLDAHGRCKHVLHLLHPILVPCHHCFPRRGGYRHGATLSYAQGGEGRGRGREGLFGWVGGGVGGRKPFPPGWGWGEGDTKRRIIRGSLPGGGEMVA